MAYKLVKQKTVTKELIGPFTLSGQEMVSASTIYIRHTKNKGDTPVVVKRLFSHPAAREEDEESDRLVKAMGGTPGHVMTIKPGDNSAKSVPVMRELPDCMYLQAAFIKTCMLINEQNILNGIERYTGDDIPREDVIFDQDGNSVPVTIDYFVYVPQGHILSWLLNISDHWRRKKGILAHEIVKDNTVKGFAVANQCFEVIKEGCLNNFIRGKIDRRPLSTIGLDVPDGANVSISTTFTYFIYPNITAEEQARLMPELHPNFVPYARVLQKEIEAVRHAEEDAEWEKKKKLEGEGDEMDISE